MITRPSKTYIVGNWKMNQSKFDIDAFFKALSQELLAASKETLPPNLFETTEAWIAPQFVHLHQLYVDISLWSTSSPFVGQMKMKYGAQNSSHKEKGAFTGDVSARALAESGCHFVIVGHSERRAFFKESPEILREKVEMAFAQNLKVIFCIGETLEEREQGKAVEVVLNQLTQSIKGLDQSKCHEQLIFAYEPVWAIGTGRTATPEQAQEMHAHIRKILSDELALEGATMPILYGGSVTPDNVHELLRQQDINGALVGGASLKGADYAKLYLAAKVKIG
ncbi:MAG: triose-phosphate isomerase [Oligoflexia bacterium]|nr:triose-phosphate isomerase [Oligoflexia bacterium]MBF0364546.1 triose-phosphate isomerase [Oligoflexia bacterium]